MLAAITDGMKNPTLSNLLGHALLIWIVGIFVYYFIREWLECSD